MKNKWKSSRCAEKAVFSNMCMITDNKGNVLVERRVKGWNGLVYPGGHVEPGESIMDSVVREVAEETGLHISNIKLCGIKQWFNKEEGRNVCFLFKTSTFFGSLKSSEEGEVFWTNIEEFKKHPEIMAMGFDVMAKVFDSEEINEMYYSDNGDSTPKLL